MGFRYSHNFHRRPRTEGNPSTWSQCLCEQIMSDTSGSLACDASRRVEARTGIMDISAKQSLFRSTTALLWGLTSLHCDPSNSDPFCNRSTYQNIPQQRMDKTYTSKPALSVPFHLFLHTCKRLPALTLCGVIPNQSISVRTDRLGRRGSRHRDRRWVCSY